MASRLQIASIVLVLSVVPSVRGEGDPVAPGGDALLPGEFLREVRPILSDHCFACHGPDDKARGKADLRLDTKEGPSRSSKTAA